MSETCIDDPLGTVKAATGIASDLEQLGCVIHVSTNLNDLTTARMAARNGPVTPFFDPMVSGLTPDRFFWIALKSSSGSIVALQAFRHDYVDTSLAEWAPVYHIGLYMRRNEVCLPIHTAPSKFSIADRIRGRLVYHGEFWVDAHARHRNLFEKFSRLGILLSVIKWNPDAIWALSNKQMASYGHLNRMGYTHLENGFLRWQWTSEPEHQIEWVSVAERRSIEQLVSEMRSSDLNQNRT